MHTETTDLNLNVLMSEEYCSVLECLMPYLDDEYEKLRTAICESRRLLLRSWETVRVTGLKIQSIARGTSAQEMDKFALELEKFSRKWR